jgi:hypothetical protein
MFWIDLHIAAVLEKGETLFVTLQTAEAGVGKSVGERLEIDLASGGDGAPAVDDQALVFLRDLKMMNGVLMEIFVAG